MKSKHLKKIALLTIFSLFIVVKNSYSQENTKKSTSINQNHPSKISELGRILESAEVPSAALDVQTVKELFPEAIVTTEQRYSTGKNQYRYRSIETVSMEKLVPALIVAIHQQEGRLKDLEATTVTN